MKEKHHCLQCGKEIPSWKKFCNSSCAATYNNLKRGKGTIHWSEEKRKKDSERKRALHGTTFEEAVCKHCGKPLGKIVNSRFKEGVCEECRPYTGLNNLYTKLGFTEGTLKDRDQKLEVFFKTLYEDKQWSVPKIAREFNLYYETVRRFFSKHNIVERHLSEAQKVSYLAGGRDVSKVDKVCYKHGFHISWEGKRFWYRSSYELEFAQILDAQKIKYEMEDKRCRTRYVDPVDGKEHVAVPDFYLPDTKELVEVKSSYTLGNIDTMKARLQSYKDAGYEPRLWLDRGFTVL